ncbi:MAG: tetratricopeptide repeat protein [Myxococcota bacterium]
MNRFLLGLPIASLAAVAACGGGSGSGSGATDPSGNTIVTGDGTAVSEEAHSRWTAAVEQFQRFEGQGWNAQRCDQSIESFEGAVEAQGGGFTEALYMAGLSADRCNRTDQAREFFNQALASNEGFCKARAAIGVMQLDGGNQQEAFNTFQRALRDDPRCTEAYVNVAMIQRTRGADSFAEALNNLRRALAIDSDYLPAFNQMALLYLDLAEVQNNNQRLDLAAVVCRQAQLIDRDYAPIYNTWGLINVRKNNIIEALQMFERATRLDNSMFEAHMNFGQITLSFRGYEDARNSFARAVELNPRDYDALIGLGAAFRGLRNMQEAQSRYEAAIQLDGNRPEAYFNLGILYQDYMSGSVEDLNRAKGFYQQFLSKAGNTARFSESVEAVNRRCQQQQSRRRRRRSTDCRPGRMQNIDTAIEALTAAAEMQRQMQQQQQQNQGGEGG